LKSTTLAVIASSAFSLMMGRLFPAQAELPLFALYVGTFALCVLLVFISVIDSLGDRIINAKQEAAEKALQALVDANKNPKAG
jgi:hypothetical protein